MEQQGVKDKKDVQALLDTIQGACAAADSAYSLALSNWSGNAAHAAREKFEAFSQTQLAQYVACAQACVDKWER